MEIISSSKQLCHNHRVLFPYNYNHFLNCKTRINKITQLTTLQYKSKQPVNINILHGLICVTILRDLLDIKSNIMVSQQPDKY